jgi:putative transcriptional regulator
MNRETETRPESLKGYFLISESNMSDPNFFQTVVLLIEHNIEGAFGLVVNRRSRLTLSDILPEFSGRLASETPVHVGGPVQQDYIFVVHSEIPDFPPSPNATVLKQGIIFEPSFRHIEKFFRDEVWDAMAEEDRPSIHLFLGFSGWAPGQLEKEMEQGSWITHIATPKIVFHPNPEEGWRDALREKGGIYRVFADSNQNPSMN